MKNELERSLRSKICWTERSSLAKYGNIRYCLTEWHLTFHVVAERRANAEGNGETWSWKKERRGQAASWKAEGKWEIAKGTEAWKQTHGEIFAEAIHKSKFSSFSGIYYKKATVTFSLHSVLFTLAQAEKIRQKEELRKEKEAARQKAANERATARRIAREHMELMEDERLELMELAARSKELPSMLSLDSDTLQQLDSFRGMLHSMYASGLCSTESLIILCFCLRE
jgi:hypothetical protein